MLDTRLMRIPEKAEIHVKKEKDVVKYDAISFAGRPGSGKGFITNHLLKQMMLDYNVSNSEDLIIRTGDIVRKYSHVEPEFKKAIESGTLVPTEIILPYVQREIVEKRKILSGNMPFVFDGFPRNVEQLDILDKSKLEVAYICVEADESTCIKGILDRARDQFDMDIDNLMDRMKVYRKETQPMVEKLKASNRALVIDNNERNECSVQVALDFYNRITNKTQRRVENNKVQELITR